MPKRNIAVVVGNGLSLAYNPALSVPEVCQEVLKRVHDDAADNADAIAVAMQKAAQATGRGDPSQDFEVLVGAFVPEGSLLAEIRRLSTLVHPDDDELAAAFERVERFSTDVRDTGVSYVLEVIAERSRADAFRREAHDDFVASVVDLTDGRVTFANLNYDTLLLAALTDRFQGDLCDMAAGYATATVTLEDGSVHTGHALRTTDNLPAERRVRLLGLHGSLTWWRRPDGTVFKFPADLARKPELWRGIRDGGEEYRPQVVLANQYSKSAQVGHYPFALSYELLRRALDQSRDWLLVGYSFRDQCLNSEIQEAYNRRADRPNVLVITLGPELTREEIERAFGWGVSDGDSADWLRVCRDGVERSTGSAEWNEWSRVFA